MATYCLVFGKNAGVGYVDNATYFTPLAGSQQTTSTAEAPVQTTARDSYTLSNLWCYIPTNTASVTSTVKTRKNLADGGQSISVTTDATGAFEDTTNTDSLTSGDEANYSVVVPSEAGTNTLTMTVLSCLSAHSGATCMWVGAGQMASTADRYAVVTGSVAMAETTQSAAQVTIRYAVNLSQMRTYIASNTANAATIWLQKNGSNGNSNVAYTAGATGEFVDSTNSDDFVAGDEANVFWDVTTAGTSVTARLIAEFEASTFMQLAAFTIAAGGVTFAADRYVVINGEMTNAVTTEANVQLKCRVTTPFQNLFANVTANTTTAATLALRQNNANVISVSVGSGATGFFEETSTVHAPSATTDLYNYFVDLTSGTSITIATLGIEQYTAAAPAASPGLLMMMGCGV